MSILKASLVLLVLVIDMSWCVAPSVALSSIVKRNKIKHNFSNIEEYINKNCGGRFKPVNVEYIKWCFIILIKFFISLHVLGNGRTSLKQVHIMHLLRLQLFEICYICERFLFASDRYEVESHQHWTTASTTSICNKP